MCTRKLSARSWRVSKLLDLISSKHFIRSSPLMVFCFKSSFLSSKDDSLISNSAFFPMTKYIKYIRHHKTKLVLHSTSLRKEYWYKDMFWSDGYFVCSIGKNFYRRLAPRIHFSTMSWIILWGATTSHLQKYPSNLTYWGGIWVNKWVKLFN